MLACVFRDASKVKCNVACNSGTEYLPRDPVSNSWGPASHPVLRKVLVSYLDLLGSPWEKNILI